MKALRNYIKNLNTPPGPPTQQGIYASPEWTGQPYPSIDWEAITQNQEPPEGWPRPPKFNEPGDVPGPPVQFGDPITPETVEAGFNYIDNGIPERNIYYYHPDHLGSSSHITDVNGDLSQHTEFMAFGEILFDEHSTSITMPYLFNGKELDSETGLYYYGVRYYDPKVSIFINVDPLVEKTLQPYQYANNNPIRYIDPDGREGKDWVYNFKTNSIYWNEDARSQATAGVNETYLGKSGTYTTQDGSTTALHSNRRHTNNSFDSLGIMKNLNPLIQAGANGPIQSVLTFGGSVDGSYIRAIPNSNSMEYAMGNPSGRLAVAGLVGMQMATSGMATELALAKVGLATKLSLSITGSLAGDGLGSLGVQTTFSSGGISMGRAISMIPANFSYIGGLNKGEGFKFADPTTKGSNNILLEYGNPVSRDVLHRGPYIRINQSGSYIERIPLKGNPALNIGR